MAEGHAVAVSDIERRREQAELEDISEVQRTYDGPQTPSQNIGTAR